MPGRDVAPLRVIHHSVVAKKFQHFPGTVLAGVPVFSKPTVPVNRRQELERGEFKATTQRLPAMQGRPGKGLGCGQLRAQVAPVGRKHPIGITLLGGDLPRFHP